MKKIFFLTALALLASVRAGAQDKPYLQDLPYYVENLAMYGEGQEDGRAFHIPAANISLNGSWKFMFYESPYDVPQDYGLRMDNRWVRFTDGTGCTARGIFDAYRAYPTGYTRTITIKPLR